jgi:hypothetical protein
MLLGYWTSTRLSLGDLLNLYSMFIGWSTKRYESGCRSRDGSSIGLNKLLQLLRVFPADDYSNRSKWRRLLPHAQYVLSHSPIDDDDEERLSLTQKSATALSSDGRYKEGEELQVQVMQTRKIVLGDEHPETLTSMNNLALAYRN